MASQKFEIIEKLPTDQHLVFYTPLEDESSVYIRTGITKNNSLLNSILCAVYSDYLCMKKPQRKALVSKVLKDVFKLEKEQWLTKNSNEYKKYCALYLSSIKNKLEGHDIDSENVNTEILDNIIISSEVCTIFFKIVNIKNLFANISNKLSNEDFKKDLKLKIDSVINLCKELKSIAEEKSNYILNQLNNFVDIFLGTIENLVYSTYLSKYENKIIEPDDLQIISEHFEKNILVIDSETRMPLKEEYIINKDDYNYIVLIKFASKNLYETLGEMLPGYITIRTFDESNVFIHKFKKELEL
jgi:hypothetical protein